MSGASNEKQNERIDSPIDRALELLISGQHEDALRWTVARLERDPADAVALLVACRLLGVLGENELAIRGLGAVVGLTVQAGNLPIGVAACAELVALGADSSVHLDEIARTFSRGSSRLGPRPVAPPYLGVAEPVVPVEGDVLHHAGEVVNGVVAKAEAPPASGQGPVPPQLLFSSLDFSGLRAMIAVFDTAVVPAGEVLIEQGSVGSEAFVVGRGELEVRRRKRDDSEMVLARLGAGALFGEMALLSRAPRAASVVACRPSIVLVARQDALDRVAAEQPQVGMEFAAHCRGRMVANLVTSSTIFSAIKKSARLEVMVRFVTRTFEQGEHLITQGQESDGLHLIASGEVEVMYLEGDEYLHLADLGVGEVVGEMGLVLRRPASANVVAKVPTVTLHLPRDGFQDLIREHPAVLNQLYELAVTRDQETTSLVAREATSAEDYIVL